jgi:predicted O-methyltransferase YrrM
MGDHSSAEAELLRRHASGARLAVEIGVWEGGSAAELRSVIRPDGNLVLIDPYPSGVLGVNVASLVARRVVGKVDRGSVRWLRLGSHEAARGWSEAIDFIFLDGEHTLEAVQRDWVEWSRHVQTGGSFVLRRDVAPGGGRTDATPAGILEWIQETSTGWQVVDRADSLAALKRVG